MAEGWGPTGANSALDTLLAAYPWLQLHTAAPGAAGTTAVAGNSTRKQAAWGAAAAGSAANTGSSLTWTSVSTSETYTKFSAWTAVTAGTFGFSGTVTANAVTAGDTFSFAAAAVTVSATLAS